MTMQQEALLFAEQNGHSAPLSAGIKLRAKVAGDDAPSKEFLAATNRVGLAFNYDSLQLSDYRISCVAPLSSCTIRWAKRSTAKPCG